MENNKLKKTLGLKSIYPIALFGFGYLILAIYAFLSQAGEHNILDFELDNSLIFDRYIVNFQ